MSLVFTTERDKPTSDWDDVQRRAGNLPPLEAPATTEAFVAEVIAAAAEDDDEELQRLRAERLDELKAGKAGPRFGALMQLAREDYPAEVNKAGEGVGVVVFLHKPRHYLSSYTETLIEKLARKFCQVKFLQIDSNECIPLYPEANLPTLLLYKDDELVGQCVGAAAFGGKSFGIDDVEWELAQVGFLKTELPKNPHEPRSK